MNKIRSIVIGLVLVFLAVSVACAQQKGGCPQSTEGRKGQILKELNLTPEQQKKLEENRTAQRQETMKLRTTIREKEEQLHTALKSPTVNQAAVQPLLNEIKALQGQLIDLRIKGIMAVKGILTPEQFAKFQQVMEEHRGNKRERFQGLREKRKEPTGTENEAPAFNH